jgi:hypothetical protein
MLRSSFVESGPRSVSGDLTESPRTFLATTTSPLLGSHAQVLGGVDAAAVAEAAAVDAAAVDADAAAVDAAAVAPSEARTADVTATSPLGTGGTTVAAEAEATAAV